MELLLSSLAQTEMVAKALADQVMQGLRPPMLFRGPLGSGKTTCISALVRALPGSESAEIASPSFSLCNYYPVTPPVVHCDLYRSAASVPEELMDALDDPNVLLLVEWADLLPLAFWPKDYLAITLSLEDVQTQCRTMRVDAEGPVASRFKESLLRGQFFMEAAHTR